MRQVARAPGPHFRARGETSVTLEAAIRSFLREEPTMWSRVSIVLTAALLAGLAHGESIVFENVRLVDLDRATVSEPMHLGVRDGFIVAADSIDTAVASEVVSDAGYLIPGLAEMHAHVPPMRDGEQHV